MSILDDLNDVGINPIVATQLMKKLNLDPDELVVPATFNMFRDVAQFFSKYENASFIISKVTYRHTDNMLNKLSEYVELQKKRDVAQSSLDKIDGELKLIQNIPEAIDTKEVLAQRKTEALIEMNTINKEIGLYER